MKKFSLIIITFLCLSCSYNHDSHIKKIENILKIDLNQYQYEVKDEEQEFVGFGKDLVILYIVFNEQSFKSFLSEINLNKFDSNKLGIYDYALTLNYEDIRMSLLIDVNNKTLKYTYFHR